MFKHELDQLQIKVAQVSESEAEEPLLFKEAAAVWVTLYGKAQESRDDVCVATSRK